MKKTILLLLTTITIFTASILTGCSNPVLQGEPLNSSGTIQLSWLTADQAGSRSTLSRANTIQDAGKVVITIETADGTAVFNKKQLNLYNFNGSFISESLSLKVGSYRLTEYLVLNQTGSVIFATPRAGSKQAHLVAEPLPINFTVTKDSTTKVIPEVVDVTEIIPADLGYATFSFAEAKVFNFLVSVMVYDLSTDNFILTDAVMDVSADAKSYSFTLSNVTNNIAVNDTSSKYSLTIKKAGYVDYTATYTNARLKSFYQNPLVVTLNKQQVITFADLNLEAAVRRAIPKPTGEIYRSDVAGLTKLDAFSQNISNLKGIEYLTSLTELYLNNNINLSDLTPLTSLTNLKIVNLGLNKISDLTPLSSLTNLTTLHLNQNSINDITPLSGLTNLTTLVLSENSISDISPLSSIISLTGLDLHQNSISNITPLSALANLTELWIYQNTISDISPLTSLTNLITLNLNNNNISDISPLSSLTKLKELRLYQNSISNIRPLSALINLTNLNLSNNSISYIGPLSSLTNLKAITITSNRISDLNPLVNNAGINSNDLLNLSGNPLSTDAKNVQIPALRARGVIVLF